MPRWYEDSFPLAASGYPDPDWEAIGKEVEQRHPEAEWREAWRDLGRFWIGRIRDVLGDGYRLHESTNFLLLSQADDERAKEILQYLETIDTEIQQSIPALIPGTLYGKCPVLIFARPQAFYEYTSTYFGGEGDMGGYGGIYLNRGYGHFAIQSRDLSYYRSVLCHELCHAYLNHLGLPLWLDEAITMGVQDRITRARPYELDREIIRRHQEYWDEEKIRDFWVGTTFGAADDGQELSYHLARFILHTLYQGGRTPRAVMEEFFLNARYEDAGQSAALEILEVSLGDCVRALMGEGNYDPPHPDEMPWPAT